jgi:23S rRNA pseudouridine1911/1915/1917 synthase
MNIEIPYQDDDLMIINKPRGMITHHGVGAQKDTLEDILQLIQRDKNLEMCGLVHRLDKNTAGLMVVAKNKKTQDLLREMMKNHAVKRTYNGIVDGVLHGNGTIDKNIVRSTRDRTLYTTVANHSPQGRDAITHYTVLENFKRYTLVKFNLETGRTHQIRVHCKSIGKPLLGDPEYNPNGKMSNGIGQMLESVEISFIHPITGKNIEVKIEPTELFKTQLGKCSKIV